MRELTHYLPIAIMTFIIGVVISPIRFDETGIACGKGASWRSYKSSYFVKLSSGGYRFPSARQADAGFQRQVNAAEEVIEQTPKLDKNGWQVGKRAVAIFSAGDRNEQIVCIFWTNGRWIEDICSVSLMHVLDFEKQQLG